MDALLDTPFPYVLWGEPIEGLIFRRIKEEGDRFITLTLIVVWLGSRNPRELMKVGLCWVLRRLLFI